MKRCRTCGLEKRFESFSPSKQTQDGLYAKCRTCVGVYQRRLAAQKVATARLGVEKVCTRCGVKKLRTQFTKNSRSSDGSASWCVTCTREASNSTHKRRAGELKLLREKTNFYQNRAIRYKALLVEAGIDWTQNVETYTKGEEKG